MRASTRILGLVGLLIFSTTQWSNDAFAEEGQRICRYCESAKHRADAEDSDANPSGRWYAPTRVADVLHIKIDVTPDFDNRTIEGKTTLRFTPIAKPLRELRLDAVRLNVHEVRSKRKIEDWSASENDLTIIFKKPIDVGDEIEIEVNYAAEPRQGLYFRTAEMGYPEGDQQIWTQGETHEARHWFPCFDYPNERSSTEVICHVPQDMTVLSNGVLVDESVDEESGLKTSHWLQEKPHANYLICLVAGYLSKLEDKHRDVPLTFYSQPSLAKHAKNSFRDTADIMAFFEEEIGLPFPWDKYAQVTIMDFMWGGMENTSLTTLTDGTIFSEETENIESSRGLDAHEMAHQWFGDYVTCKDWSHLWLNEGFATYYESLHAGHQFGHDALLHSMYGKAKGVLSRTDDTRPIVYKAYSRPAEQFDYRAYPKGAWVLHMLRSQLGKDLYRKCIKTYLERHALTDVVTDELNSVIEEVSGQSFDQFFDQWVYHARFPDLRVSYRWMPAEKLAKVTVEQTHEVNDHVMLFEFPTKIRFQLGSEVVDHDVEISQPKHEFFVRLPSKPKIVRFDPDYTILATVQFRKSDEMLRQQLADDADVIGRLYAVRDLSSRKTGSAIAALKKALNEDGFHGVRVAAAEGLRSIGNDDAYEALVESVEQPDARVRRSVVSQIGKFYRTETRDVLCEVIDGEQNPAIVETAIRALGKYTGKEVDSRIREALVQESFGNRTTLAAIGAIDAQASAKFRDDLLEVLKDRNDDLSTRQIRRGLQVLCRLPNSKKVRQATFKFVSDYLEHPRPALRAAAIQALGELGHPGSKRVLKALVDDPNERISSSAREALSKLEKGSTADVADLRRTINGLRERQETLEEQIDDLTAMIEAHGKTVNELANSSAKQAEEQNKKRRAQQDPLDEEEKLASKEAGNKEPSD